VGIIALVDEATGYQRLREELALASILEKFIAKEPQPWTKDLSRPAATLRPGLPGRPALGPG